MPKLKLKAAHGSTYSVVDAKGALYFNGTLKAANQYIAWQGTKKSVREVTDDLVVTLPKGSRSGRKVTTKPRTRKKATKKNRTVTALDITGKTYG